MMESKEIREQGWLERYLLGELSEEEVRSVEVALRKDPQLKMDMDQLEADLEKMAFENAIDPPTHVKSQLMDQVYKVNVTTIPLNENRNNRAYLAIAASLALLFGISSFWLFSKVNSMEEDLQLVQEENTELQNNVLELQSDLAETTQWYEAVNDPGAIKLILAGNTNSPNALAISYVNHDNKSVVLDAKGLPKLAEDQDYQMWADVDGVMIDMGVIPKDTEMIAMTYIDRMESLNITIEPAGGNDHPTVENLISNVYLN